MIVSVDELARYSESLNAIADEAVAAFMSDMRSYAAEMGGFGSWGSAQKREFREYAIDRMTECWSTYAEASSSVGSLFFDATVEGGLPEGYPMVGHVDAERARKSARYWAGFMYGNDGNIDQFLNGCSLFVHRNVSHSADRLAVDLAARDKKLRFARVPQGPTCGFCIMLASQGFVYHSAKTAGAAMQYHNGCDCRIIPGYEGLRVEGYDPDGMRSRYSQCLRTANGGSDVMPGGLLAREWNALSDAERAAYGKDGKASFDDYVTKRVCAEMDARDRRWLYDGTEPDATFETPELEQEIRRDRPHEIETAKRLKKNGVRSDFVVDEIDYTDASTGRKQRIGLADFKDGTEIKSLNEASSFNTIDGYIKNTSRKKNAARLVFDNSQNDELSDSDLVGMISQSRRFRRGSIYIIDRHGELVRVK